MPLLKRSPFSFLEPPENLDPNEKVFQISFTREIFRGYQEYQERLNFYNQKVWTCKVSGKSNMTYTEALACEKRAAEKAQQLPEELIAPVLQTIQHSTLRLTDLVEKVYSNLLLEISEGLELYAKKDGSKTACKILKVISSGDNKSYEVGWVGPDNVVVSTSVVNGDDLIRKKAPVSRNTLKMFIRGSTSKSSPWTLDANLAKKYGILSDLPEDIMNGEGLWKPGERLENGATKAARKRFKKDEKQAELPVKYPIDDLLINPEANDPALSKRPPLSTDFRVPIESVVDLLMVTLVTWADYLCDFMEVMGNEEFSCKLSTVRRGHYGLLETGLKLKILRVLVDEAIATSAVRVEINEQIDQRQAFAAAKREDFRKNRKEYMLNMRGVEENRTNQSDTTQNDTGSYQHGGKEHKDLNSFSTSKTGDGKMYLRKHLETEIQQQSVWPSPLGKDRLYNRYWFFEHEGRLFVESANSKEWGYYNTKEELDALLGSLNTKGIRERELKRQLSKSYDNISNALEKRMKDVEQKPSREEAVLRRSTRVHAQPKDDNPSMSFLKYINKWKKK
ncbi:hypothetical protein QOZ80_4BG0348030 [Eleusine coracana subsp. coracana]|nr:hypothetical protein QOZ80_4BG0348030 [Eleusine coracana subsp. coracana]